MNPLSWEILLLRLSRKWENVHEPQVDGGYSWLQLCWPLPCVSFQFGSQANGMPSLSLFAKTVLSKAKVWWHFHILNLKIQSPSRAKSSYFIIWCLISSMATPFWQAQQSSWNICNFPNLPVPLPKLLHFLESLPFPHSFFVALIVSSTFVKIQTCLVVGHPSPTHCLFQLAMW